MWEEPWPQADEALLERDMVTLVVQVNGKVRDRIEVAGGRIADEMRRSRASSGPTCSATSTAGQVVREVVVPGRLVNFVVR